ncbi:Hypothetical_protein [Hexamita inflata]|uniref:Hypothetical_protein n=1 Tax=Hexamita inflata TaxID=28002 RepID=A0AA86P3M8_9EUKA|nr:Hypothetical protein HINF_LOCUS18688 [Hexamita inflata]
MCNITNVSSQQFVRFIGTPEISVGISASDMQVVLTTLSDNSNCFLVQLNTIKCLQQNFFSSSFFYPMNFSSARQVNHHQLNEMKSLSEKSAIIQNKEVRSTHTLKDALVALKSGPSRTYQSRTVWIVKTSINYLDRLRDFLGVGGYWFGGLNVLVLVSTMTPKGFSQQTWSSIVRLLSHIGHQVVSVSS